MDGCMYSWASVMISVRVRKWMIVGVKGMVERGGKGVEEEEEEKARYSYRYRGLVGRGWGLGGSRASCHTR